MKSTTRHLPLLLLVLALFIPHLATAQQAAPQGPEPSTIVFTVQQGPGWNGYTLTGTIQLNFLDTLGNNFQVAANYDQNSTPSSIASDLVSNFLQTYPSLSTSSWSGTTGATLALALPLYDNFEQWTSWPPLVSGWEYSAVFNFNTAGPQPPNQPPQQPSPSSLPTVNINPDGSLTITPPAPHGSQYPPPPTEQQLLANEMASITIAPDGFTDNSSIPGWYIYTVAYQDGSSITVTETGVPYTPNPPIPLDLSVGNLDLLIDPTAAPVYDGGGGGGGDPYDDPCGFD